MATAQDITLLLDRPNEPLFMPKGSDDRPVIFEAPPEFYNKKYRNQVQLATRFDDGRSKKITLSQVRPPDLSVVQQLPREADFSLFVPRHQKIAAALIDILIKVPEGQIDQFISTAAFCRDKVNTQLFNYCLSVALLHRNDSKNVRLPNFMERFPSGFVDSRVVQDAREEAAIIPQQVRTPIMIPRDFTASDLELEHRLAYFREDIGINLHHWHWHLVYPFTATERRIVAKDRRGELFYYMHQQLVARYNTERLCNQLGLVKRFNNHREPIEEGYFPKLDSMTSARTWPGRQGGMTWVDLDRSVDQIRVTVDTMDIWLKRLEDAIDSGYAQMADGSSQPLDIDVFGYMVEASDLSPNQNFYGNYHNFGHLFTAYLHDPNHKYLERFGVMADPGTTMRDPFFYRWHAHIDTIFQKFKRSNAVQPYRRADLDNQGITVNSVQVNTQGGQPNVLLTYWMQSDVDMSRGLDFSERGPVLVRFTHLQHMPFSYRIQVNNSGNARRGTVRIFMAPKYDQRGLPWRLPEQRLMMIEMDRFVVQLNRGNNVIPRRSDESNVTIPFERTFRNLSAPQGNTAATDIFNFCGCGWPQHMLVPKGTAQGMQFELFVMVSNYEQDRVDQNIDNIPCADAFAYCGIKDSRYPDRRAMGYPFDRPPATAQTLNEFLYPNMKVQDVVVRFSDRTIPNPNNPQQRRN